MALIDQKLFGTDGIRGVANRFPMTSEVAMDVGRAVASYFRGRAGRDKSLIIIGKDTRRSSYMIETALASGITSQGVNVLLLGPMPTPGVSFLTKSMRADAGIMVSASHNTYEYNGIKIFGTDGFKLDDHVERQIEEKVLSGQAKEDLPVGDGLGRARRIDDVMGRYIVTVKNHLPQNVSLRGLSMVLDCANGAAYSCAPVIFDELGADVHAIHNQPNGININHKCGAVHSESMRQKVKEGPFELGVALDGDADRVIMCDENGELVDGDALLAILALDRAERGTLNGRHLVVTPMSNLGLEKALQAQKIQVHYADVGDRAVVSLMKKLNANLGGEQSGHIVFLDQSSTGDGTLAALEVMSVMRRKGQPLSQLKKCFQAFPQVLLNVSIVHKKPLESLNLTQKAIVSAQKNLGLNGRVFVRYSGTEPLCRVMIEGENHQQIKGLAEDIADALQKELSA